MEQQSPDIGRLSAITSVEKFRADIVGFLGDEFLETSLLLLAGARPLLGAGGTSSAANLN